MRGDSHDQHLHELFRERREQMLDVVDGFSDRVMERVDALDSTQPRCTDVVVSGLVELGNMVSFVDTGHRNGDDDDAV